MNGRDGLQFKWGDQGRPIKKVTLKQRFEGRKTVIHVHIYRRNIYMSKRKWSLQSLKAGECQMCLSSQ